MDIRKIPTESTSQLIAQFKLDQEVNAIDRFLELALSNESDEDAKKKIKAFISQGYDINFSSLRNIPQTTIYFFAPPTLFLPLYVNKENRLKSINRLITSGGSINYLAMGFAISGQVDMAEELRTKYQADVDLIYMGYVTHVFYTSANLNVDHLTQDKSLISKTEVIDSLIHYYEKKLLNDEKAKSIKKRVKLKLGDWKSDFLISENIDFNNPPSDHLEKIINSIQYEFNHLIYYCGSKPAMDFKKEIVCALEALQKKIQLNPNFRQIDLLNQLNQQLESAIIKYKNSTIPISQLFLHSENLKSNLDQYQKKLHTLENSERANFIYDICETMICFNKAHLLDYFYKEYQFYINNENEGVQNQNKNLLSLISTAISVGYLAFAKRIATDYPKALNGDYSTRLRLMKNAGQGNLAADKTQEWGYYGTWCQKLPSSWVFEDEIGYYLSGAFNAYPEIRLSLQHFEKFKPKPLIGWLPEDYYQIYIRQLFQLNSFTPREQKPDPRICQALSFKNPAIIMMLAQMPIEFLIEAETHFRIIYFQGKIDFPLEESLLIKAIYIIKMMGIIQFKLEEAHHLKSLIDDFKNYANDRFKSDKEKPDHAIPISIGSKSEIFYPWKSFIYFLSCNKKLNQPKGKTEIFVSEETSAIPIEIFLKILSYLFPIPKPDYPLIDSKKILEKLVYSQNRYLLFSPKLIVPEMKIIDDRVFKKN